MSKFGYKTWETSKPQIERTIAEKCFTGGDRDVEIKSGFQLRETISHYPSPLISYCYHEDPANGDEYYVINYMSSDGGMSVVVEWKYDIVRHSLVLQKKFTIRNCLRHLLWIANQKAFIGYCDDMTLRGYMGSNMEEKVRVPVSSTVLCIIYLEDLDEFITGGQGQLIAWRLHPIEFRRPFQWKDPQFICDVNDNFEIWITRLSYSRHHRTLLALSGDAVYLIDMKTRKQFDIVKNSHKATLTGCAWYPRFSYIITAARDGSIHVHHTIANSVIHRFPAHRDGMTGVECMTTHPVLVSWSCYSGCVRLWRLDTLEMLDESSLSETIANLALIRPDRLVYSTESGVRIFEINIIFTIFATLSAPAKCLLLRWIDKPTDIKSVLSMTRHRETCTEIRNRLMCILDDGSVISLSPVSGSIVHFIYPSTERKADQHPANVSVNIDGTMSFVLLENGGMIEYDCVINPGSKNSLKNYADVTSVVTVETKFRESEGSDWEGNILGSEFEHAACAVLLGCDTGYIKLHQDASYVVSGNNFTKTYLDMKPIKIHAGAVSNLFVSCEKKALAAYTRNYNSDSLNNDDFLMSTGTDKTLIIWHMDFTKDKIMDVYEMTLQKLVQVQLDFQPKLITGSSHLIMFTYDDVYINIKKIYYNTEENGCKISSIESILPDPELRHTARITNISHSDLLNIFLTCGMFELIKVWDQDGLIIREIDLADTWSACFCNGRDILVSYRNHIVLIEAYIYLPMEILDQLLDFDEKWKIKDVEPETPIPMKGGTDMGACGLKPRYSTFEPNEEPKLSMSTKQKLMKRRVTALLRRKNLRRKKIPTASSLDLVDSDTEEENVKNESERRKHLLEIPKCFSDPAILTDSLIKRIESCPVAPDGYIPNSVIRKRVEPIFYGIVEDIWKRQEFGYVSEDNTEEDASISEISDVDDRLHLKHALPLKGSRNLLGEYIDQEGETYENQLKKQTELKYSAKSEHQRLRRLQELLKKVNNEKWCPVHLDISHLEDGLVELSDAIENITESAVVTKILSTDLKIIEELKHLAPAAGNCGISVQSQRAIADNLLPLFTNDSQDIRRMATSLVSKFDDTILEGVIDRSGRKLRYILKSHASKDKTLSENMDYTSCMDTLATISKYFTSSALQKSFNKLKDKPMDKDFLNKIKKFGEDFVDFMISKDVQKRDAETWATHVFQQAINYDKIKRENDINKIAAARDLEKAKKAELQKVKDEKDSLHPAKRESLSSLEKSSGSEKVKLIEELKSTTDISHVQLTTTQDSSTLDDITAATNLTSKIKSTIPVTTTTRMRSSEGFNSQDASSAKSLDGTDVLGNEKGDLGITRSRSKKLRSTDAPLRWAAKRPVNYKDESLCVLRCSHKGNNNKNRRSMSARRVRESKNIQKHQSPVRYVSEREQEEYFYSIRPSDDVHCQESTNLQNHQHTVGCARGRKQDEYFQLADDRRAAYTSHKPCDIENWRLILLGLRKIRLSRQKIIDESYA